MEGPLPADLVCPRCRIPGEDGLLRVLVLDPESLTCPGCGSEYPTIDGVRCVPPALAAFREAQLGEQPEDVHEASLPGVYALAHFPDCVGDEPTAAGLLGNLAVYQRFAGWIGQHGLPDGCDGPVLDAGCAVGRLTRLLAPLASAGAIGLDVRLSLLRVGAALAGGGRVTLPRRACGGLFRPLDIEVRAPAGAPLAFVQGDVLRPPFQAEAFPAVAAVSLVDTVPDPVVALGQLDAMLAPGGLLLIASPYQWEARATPREAWWDGGPAVLRSLLAGGHPALPHIAYELLEEEDGLPWHLVSHDRLSHRYTLHALLARKC